MLAEYDLEMNWLDAMGVLCESPFWKAATAEIKIPE
jgi:hypothetical protein